MDNPQSALALALKRPVKVLVNLALLLPLSLQAAPNPKFGFVGTGGRAFSEKFNLPYYTLEGNYHSATGSLFSSVHPDNDPAPGKMVVREVAKLNVRLDELGETNEQFDAKIRAFTQRLIAWIDSGGIIPAPSFPWYQPDMAALAASEESQILQTMERERTREPAITGTVWEIGNEPNLLPALKPQDYAALFSKYHAIIKAKDPTAKIAFGSLFLREPAEDLRPRLEAMIKSNLLETGLVEGTAKFDFVFGEVKANLFSRIFATGTLEYIKACFNAMDPKVKPDLITFHVYPYDDRPPTLTTAAIKYKVDSLISGMNTFLATKGLHLPIWVTEFGNINPTLDTPEKVRELGSAMIDVFEGNPAIEKWFYYKSTGADKQFALLPNTTPPLTRLAKDSTFEPILGDFPCSRMNIIGLMYFQRSTGSPCSEKLSFALPTSQASESEPMHTIKVKLHADAEDTITVQYSIKSASAQKGGVDYSLEEGTLIFVPGETEKNISLILNDDAIQEGQESFTLVLRNPSQAELSADSLHTFSILDNDNDLPQAPAGLSASPAFKKVLLIWNQSKEKDLLRHYLYQGSTPEDLSLVDSTSNTTDTSIIRTDLKNGQAYYFKIQARDSAGQIGPLSAMAQATPINLSPTITSKSQDTAIEGSPFFYVATATDDETKPSISYSNSPSWLSVHGDSLVGTPPAFAKDTSFTLQVSDGELTASMSVTLLIRSINHKPTITSIVVEKPIVAEGDTLLLQAAAQDIDKDSLHYLWLIQGADAKVADTLGRSAQVIFRPGYSSLRKTKITLIVHDARGLAVDSTIELPIKNTSIPPRLSGLTPIVNSQSSFSVVWPLLGRDPDLESNYRFEIGLFQDSLLALGLKSKDSLNAGPHTLAPFMGLGDYSNRKAWVAVRARDSSGYKTEWSIPQAIIFEILHPTTVGNELFPHTYGLKIGGRDAQRSETRITVFIPFGNGNSVPIALRRVDMQGRANLWKWKGMLSPGSHEFSLPTPLVPPTLNGNTVLEMQAPGKKIAKKI